MVESDAELLLPGLSLPRSETVIVDHIILGVLIAL